MNAPASPREGQSELMAQTLLDRAETVDDEGYCRIPAFVAREVSAMLRAHPPAASTQEGGEVERLDIPHFRRTGMLIDDRTAEITESIHQCRACGCFWRLWKNDLGWSLADAHQKSCARCDNSPEFVSLLTPSPTPETPAGYVMVRTEAVQFAKDVCDRVIAKVEGTAADGRTMRSKETYRLCKELKAMLSASPTPDIQKDGIREGELMAGAKALIWMANRAVEKMEFQNSAPPHAEVDWLRRAKPYLVAWLRLSGAEGGIDFHAAYRDLDALLARVREK